ncbi:MAG: sterol desaturase family protein [Gammaproteobacteria bacterium]|nr:sterol desaturase family protein [Gammaproteobacteria bacterium]
MNLDLDHGKLLVFVIGFVVFFALETYAPARVWRQSRWRRLGFHSAVSFFNTVMTRHLIYVPSLLWAVYVEEQGYGLARWWGLVGVLEILAAVVVLDGFDYFWHRANHRVRFFWRFHKAHHADTALDLTTVLRFHPGELLLSAGMKAVWILVWGPTVVAWFLFETLVSLCAQFHHSNVDFPETVERYLSWVLVTPRFHAAHHAVDQRYGNRNFSTIFSFWDHLFGSYARPADGGATTNAEHALGLPEGRALAFSALAWVTEPWAARNLSLSRLQPRPIVPD